jgi:copper(I)-binding protein
MPRFARTALAAFAFAFAVAGVPAFAAPTIAGFALASAPTPTSAGSPAAGPLAPAARAATSVEVRGAWARATPPAAEVAAAYLELRSRTADRLLAVSTPVARRAEVHSTSMRDGVMEMRHLEALTIPAGTPVVLKPGGLHLMLLGLSAPLVAGQRFPLELRFERAGVVRTEVLVRADDGGAHGAP